MKQTKRKKKTIKVLLILFQKKITDSFEILDNYIDTKSPKQRLFKSILDSIKIITDEIKIIKEDIELIKEDQLNTKSYVRKVVTEVVTEVVKEENKKITDKLSVIERILLENRSIYTNAIQKVSNQEEENSKTINNFIKKEEKDKIYKEKLERKAITPSTIVRENNRLWRQQSCNTTLGSIFKVPVIFNSFENS